MTVRQDDLIPVFVPPHGTRFATMRSMGLWEPENEWQKMLPRFVLPL